MEDFIYERNQNYLFSFFYRETIGKKIVLKLKNTKITPNMITFFSFLVIQPLCCICAFYQKNIVLAALIQIVFISDILDGDLARNAHLCSTLGAKLDIINDSVFYLLMYPFMEIMYSVDKKIVIAHFIIYFVYGRIATHFIVPNLRKMKDIKRFPIKQFLWDRGILLGMDISFQGFIFSLFLIIGKVQFGVVVICILWIVDLLYRNMELIYNKYLKSEGKANANK